MFPQIIVDMVRVAETGGKLDVALKNGAAYLQRSAELRRKIVNAMLYPSVMLGVSMITIFILVVFVMPRFAQVFVQMKADIPALTKLMLVSGNVIRGNPVASAVAFVILVALAAKGSSIPLIRNLTARLLDKTPMLGSLLRKLAIARALQSIATLTSSNVPLLTAIEQGAKVAGNITVERVLLDARDQIEQGSSMSDALKTSNVFPRQIVQMIAIGEKSGRLSQLLDTVCGSMETEIDGRLKALVSIIEPMMIVSMGLIVGSITMSIIGPIYSVIENIR
ncbi:MAG TPA: type II secretion system F family protein, partial [Fimbriimonas sp.]|nr:type II secretion system F family protein [Fimbriimonas sp.]